MTIPLSDADHTGLGSKARTLARLRRAGLPVPDGFVVPADANQPGSFEVGRTIRSGIGRELTRLGEPVVAVRSSSVDEDTTEASAAGMYESLLGVRGTDDVTEAIAACRRSANTARVRDYLRRGGRAGESATAMAVLVQVLIEAEVSGVMYTPRVGDEPTRIESSWGLGVSVVGGGLTPDAYEVGPSGRITARIGVKRSRSDSGSHGTETTAVSGEMRTSRTLNDATLLSLATLGTQVAAVFDGPQDIEWAIAGNKIWIIQSRPVTAALPAMPEPSGQDRETLVGTPGSHGIVTAHARMVSGPSTFTDVTPGEVVICPYTDPAWTPLFSIASGVITEVGGALSHAAIVAREYGIPAVLGVAEVRTHIADGALITIDGSKGTITMH